MSTDMKKLDEEIESDDEFPSDYVDIPDIPAYKDDLRFQNTQVEYEERKVNFPWLNKLKDKKIQDPTTMTPVTLYTTLNEKIVQEKMENIKDDKFLVTKGVLNQQDIFCLKSIETINCDGTLLWLINFFMYKDLQADYKFLKTCLVGKYIHNIIKNNNNNELNINNTITTHQFEIVAL